MRDYLIGAKECRPTGHCLAITEELSQLKILVLLYFEETDSIVSRLCCSCFVEFLDRNGCLTLTN